MVSGDVPRQETQRRHRTTICRKPTAMLTTVMAAAMMVYPPSIAAITPAATAVPVTPVTPTAPVTPVTPPAPTPRTATDPIDGIEAIRHFYGEETANRMLLDDTRKAYYVLDEQDLTNEELIERLEHLPAYNRKLSDLGQLRAVSRQPAKARPASQPGNIEKTLDL